MSSTPRPQNGSDAIVITGTGLVCALGLSTEQAWNALRDGRSGIGSLTALEQPPGLDKGGAEAPALPAEEADPDTPREVAYLKRALAEAIQQAGIDHALPHPGPRCGVSFGTTLHGMRAGGRYFRRQDPAALQRFQANAILQQAAGELGLTGLGVSSCAACASGLASIGLAVTLLRTGALDLVLAGGYDPISEYACGGFDALGLVTSDHPRPFAKDRSGMKLGESYGIVVLERAADAARRGAPPLAKVLGLGESSDAHHLTQPHPQGRGAAKAMRTALESAGLGPDQIGLISAHGTGTPDNEIGETAALESVFASALPETPMAAMKHQLGHSLGGAGTSELILTLQAMRAGLVPPTPGVADRPTESENLCFVPEARPARIHATLSSAFGFGGANACVVLGRADADAADATHEPPPAAATTGPAHNPSANESSSPNDVVLTGIGLVTPDGHGEDALQALHANALRDQPPPPIDPDALGQLVQARRVRRMSDYVKLSLAATRLAMEQAGLDQAALDNPRTGALLGTTHGSADYCAQYYHQIVAEGIDAANAMLFAEGVPNAAAAHLSLSIGLTGPCQTLIGARTAGLEALHLAALRIAEGRWDRAIVAAAEEATDHIRAVYHHCGLHADRQGGGPFGPVQGFVLGSGAATLVLARREVAEQRGTPIFGTITAAGTAFHQSGRMREAAHQWQGLVETLGHPGAFISSANSTWPGRIEAAAIGLAAAGETPTVTSLYGHLAETFAVGPLAALGVAARTGRLPALHGEPPPGPVTPAANGTPAEDFAVLATDYEGPLAAVRFRRA